MSSILKKDLQIPYRDEDLLTVLEFITYAKRYNITVTEQELEYYEKEELLLPAVRVKHGFTKLIEVLADFETPRGTKREWRYINDSRKNSLNILKESGKSKYLTSGISRRHQNWLMELKQEGLAFHPSETGFKPWSLYRSKNDFSENPNSDQLEVSTFYVPYQVYLLNLIRKRFRLVISNQGLYRDEHEWIEFGKFIYKQFDLNTIRETIGIQTLKFHEMLLDFYTILKLQKNWRKELDELFVQKKEILKRYPDNNSSDKLSRNQLETELHPKFKENSMSLINSIKSLTEELTLLREMFIELGSFNRRNVSARKYVRVINAQILTKYEDPYKWAAKINWYLWLIGRKKKSIQATILSTSDYKKCIVCGVIYKPRNKRQKTCGHEPCIKTNKNMLKKMYRAENRY